MTPDEREFGILIGKVDGLGEQIAELRRTNSSEHRHTAERFDKLETLLAGKADRPVVDSQGERIDSLESTRDKGSGAANVFKVAQGLALLVLPAVGLLIGKGLG